MIKQELFGRTASGKEVTLYTLQNRNGMEMKVMNYGCIVVSLTAPDRTGNLEDIVLGFNTLAQYEQESPFFGAIIGRYGNRIAKGRFSLDGREYTLAVNNGPNHLHGGVKSFDKVLWNAHTADTPDGPTIHFTYISPDGEEGYPGTLSTHVTYVLSDKNEFRITIEATTDNPTVVNLCQHSYFNLLGKARHDILGHELYLNANRFVAIDPNAIPTGELRLVDGTPFDFRTPRKVGAHIDDPDEQLINGKGYDHTFVFHESVTRNGALAGSLFAPETGRYMEVHTTEPGVQFYSGNYLTGYRGKDAAIYYKRFGLCLETQHFPDSPNRPEFPSVVLRPGQKYHTNTVYSFSTRN